jgi:hypothetical protein
MLNGHSAGHTMFTTRSSPQPNVSLADPAVILQVAISGRSSSRRKRRYGYRHGHWLRHEVQAERETKNARQIALRKARLDADGICSVRSTKTFR